MLQASQKAMTITTPAQNPSHFLANRCGRKIESLQWIGLIGGEEADKALRQALTRDGARELIKEWIDGPLPDWVSVSWENEPKGQLIEKIQGYAAIGIVRSQNQQSIQLVEKLLVFHYQ